MSFNCLFVVSFSSPHSQGSRAMVCRSVESQQGCDGFNILHNTNNINLYFFFLAEQQCFIIIIPTLRNPIRDCNCFFYGCGSASVCLYSGSSASIFFFQIYGCSLSENFGYLILILFSCVVSDTTRSQQGNPQKLK